MWSPPRPATAARARTGHQLRGPEPLEDRSIPANLLITGATLVDASNVAMPNPVYGQNIYVRANWQSQAMTGGEPSVPVRYTANYPADYFAPGSAPASFPANSGSVNHGFGNGSWNWWRGGWYAGTAAFTVTVTVDPDNQIIETNETDNATILTVIPVAPADLPSRFLQPIGLTPNSDWAITNYADIDPRGNNSRSDYRRGLYVYDGHDAIDAGPIGFARQDTGVPLHAVADGTIDRIDGGNFFDRETSWSGGQNWNAVWVNHGNGWRTVYGHMAAGSVAVKVGDAVKAGQLLGLMGSSGVSTGTHIHYTAYYRGCQVEAGFSPSSYWIDPLPYAGDAASFYFNAGVTNYSPSGDLGEKPSQATRFGTTDPAQTVYFYIQGYNLKTTDVMYWRWIRPDGTTENTSSFSPSGNFTYSNWWWSRPLSGFQGATGTWQVVFYLNGTTPAHEQKRQSFEVVAGTGSGIARVSENTTGRLILDGRTTPVDFGSAGQFAVAPQRSFTVQNRGNGPLALANFVLPPGFSLVSAPASLPPGGSGTITLQMDTAVVGAKFGAVRFDTGDPAAPVYEFNLSGTVTGSAPGGSPAIGLTGNPAAAYNFTSLPRPLSPTATVADPDSANFAGGTLTVEFASFGVADDRLGIRHQGTGAGQIGVSGSTVTYAGTPIGTFAGGVGTTPLVVTLNADATLAATQALLRNLTYQNVSVVPTTQRKAVRFTLTDGTGNTSNLAVQHVINSGVARNPTIATLPTRTVVRGTALNYTGAFTDPWGGAWSATVDYGDGSGPQPLTLNSDRTFTLSHLYTAVPGNYTVAVTVVSDIGGTATATLPVTVAAPVGVAPVLVNAGTGQRSMVTSLTITFGGLVTLPADAASAFSLVGPGGAVGLVVDTSGSTATQTIVRLTFTGAGVIGGSLADGRYTLTVFGALLADPNGAPIDGDGDGLAGGNSTAQLHRFFGDSDGDGDVDVLDLGRFRQAYGRSAGQPGYAADFDFDGDGDVDVLDLGRFRLRYGRTLP